MLRCPDQDAFNLLQDGDHAMTGTYQPPTDDPWDAFVLDDETAEPEPEPGDFWGELDNDSDNSG